MSGLLRYLTAQFCDDIRLESGNKNSLMGCYDNVLIMGEYPIVINRLCVLISIYTPAANPFKAPLTIRAICNDVVMAETTLSQEYLKTIVPGKNITVMKGQMVFSPVTLNEESSIVIEAISDEWQFQAEPFVIRALQDTDDRSVMDHLEKTRP